MTGLTVTKLADLFPLIVDVFGWDMDRKPTMTDGFVADCGGDDVKIAALVAKAEQKYGITIDPKEVPAIKTIGDFLDMLGRYGK